MNRTARFWVWENGGWVKLTLKPGEERSRYHSCRTEEGYAADCVTWTSTEEGVLRESATDGRDCDGRYSSCRTDLARFENLHAVPAWVEDGAPPELDEKGQPLMRPHWEEERPACIFDEYAQAVGY
jgi:hypothetical protein